MFIPDLLLERGDSLDLLMQMAERSRGRSGQIALISGEAGIGKSSLIAAMTQNLDEGIRVIRGHCDALFTPRHLGPFYDIGPSLGAQAQTALSTGSNSADLFPIMLSALNDLPAGSIVVFEDLHWADHASLDLLKFISRRLAPLRILLILTYRDDEVGPEHPLPHLLGDLPTTITTRVDLKPLSEQAVAELAQHHKRDPLGLYRATGGNPFFLSEILAHQAVGDSQPPGSVRDAVLARIARIGEEERQLLAAISVAPDPVSYGVIGALLGQPGLDACSSCETRGLLVVEGDQGVRFRHELARMSVLESLSASERHLHHQHLLDVYLSAGSDAQSDRIVHHAAALNDAAILLSHAPKAAARAARLGACRDAAAMLAIALEHVNEADTEQAAQLYEDWAYQASLFEVTDRVLDARREALARWRALNRADRVGDNLRWLWRLHWYRGEMAAADAAAEESILVLEGIPPSAELARAYALRAHINLLRAQRNEAVEWGSKAIEMANHFEDLDTHLQALVTVATARLFSGQSDGARLMEQALDLARAHGFHEEAARVYTNYSEYAIVTGNVELAERLVLDGLAFDIKHGLDAWTSYLMGRHAQLRFGQGRLHEARTLAHSALENNEPTVLMQLPALTILAQSRSREGEDDAEQSLNELLGTVLEIGEQQRITPVRLALIEHHYLREQWVPARAQLDAMVTFGTELLRPWDAGAVQLWAARLRVSIANEVGGSLTEPQRLELQGDHQAAAVALEQMQLPFDAALCRLAGARAGQLTLLRQAADGFVQLGCTPGAEAVRLVASGQGVRLGRSGSQRKQRRTTHTHPLGLTRKEVEVLTLMTEGASNAEIADRMSRSQRTIEHHVSSILDKLNASNRLEAILRVMAEPWIAQS